MSHLRFVPGAFNLDGRIAYGKLYEVLTTLNCSWKYPIISVGSSKGHLEYMLKKDTGFEVIRVDPNMGNGKQYDADEWINDPDYNTNFIPAQYKSIDEIPDINNFIHRCILLLSWPIDEAKRNGKDHEFFSRLRPAIFIASFSPCGKSAGSIKLINTMGFYLKSIESYQNICPPPQQFEEKNQERTKTYHLWLCHDSILNTGAVATGGLTNRLLIYCANTPFHGNQAMKSRQHHGTYVEPEKPSVSKDEYTEYTHM